MAASEKNMHAAGVLNELTESTWTREISANCQGNFKGLIRTQAIRTHQFGVDAIFILANENKVVHVLGL